MAVKRLATSPDVVSGGLPMRTTGTYPRVATLIDSPEFRILIYRNVQRDILIYFDPDDGPGGTYRAEVL